MRGRVLGRDVDGDLAVVEAETGDAPALSVGGSDPVVIGTPGSRSPIPRDARCA